ncbi:MAG: hypothetical protein ACRCW4_06345 [Candidatus Neomicrothrix subdominans]
MTDIVDGRVLFDGRGSRICDLFGLSVEGASRYLKTVEQPDLAAEGERTPTT